LRWQADLGLIVRGRPTSLMSDLRLRARSSSEIVDAAFQLYRREPVTYLVVSALAYAPWIVIQLLVLDARELQDPLELIRSGRWVITWIGSVATYSLAAAVMVRASSEAYLGRKPDAGAAVSALLPRVPAIAAAAVLKSILLGIGVFFLVVGAFYALGRWFAVMSAMVIEGRGIGDAFSRSTQLSRGIKWHIVKTYLLTGVIYFVIAMAASVLFAFTQSPVIALVVSTTVTIVMYPLFGIIEMLLYYDARIRNEGYDIEVMAGALEGVPRTEGFAS
jgi:hypothetical protein